MPRQVDADVHSSFVEFRPSDDNAKCIQVQCIYCRQTRAKNTTRQKQHLLRCAPYLQAHPEAALQASAAAASAVSQAPGPANAAPDPAGTSASSDAPGDASYSHDDAVGEHTNLTFVPNPRINGSPHHVAPHGAPLGAPSAAPPLPAPPRPSVGADGQPAPKKQKTKSLAASAGKPDIPLREVHASFVEFKAKEDDKCISARCIYCNQVRAKNTSRQREHLLSCPGYQAVLKERIPANNLRHQFEQDDVASTLAIPLPLLDLDFRMSVKVKPKLNVGPGISGRQSWVSCMGGQWAGRWGKGVLLSPGGEDIQTTVKDTATRFDARYLMQTSDEHPALIVCKVKGWLTGDRDVMERLQDPVAADNVAANRYQLRVTMELETGDERYAHVNTGVWLASGCRRGAEIVYDVYRIG